MTVLLSLVGSLFIPSGKSTIADRAVVRLKSVVRIKMALKIGSAGEYSSTVFSWARIHHCQREGNVPS